MPNLSPLPFAFTNYDNKVVAVTGWGTLSSRGSQQNIVQKVLYTFFVIIFYVKLYCTGGCEHDDKCQVLLRHTDGLGQGDSGGPMVTNEGSVYSINGNKANTLDK